MMDPYGLWYEQPLIVFDVETTGLNHTEDRVVEVGLARFERGEVVDRWGTLVYPKREIPDEAAAIHGITTADVATAPPFVVAIPHLLRLGQGAHPVAYNSRFDKTFFFTEMFRTRVGGFRGVPMFDKAVPWIDPLVWVRYIRKHIWKGNKLTESCDRFGIGLEHAHRADDDALAAGRLMLSLREYIGDMTITELLRRQRPIFDAHEKEFSAWQARKRPRR